MTVLIASILALAVGPVAYRYARRRRRVVAGLDRFVIVAVPALVAWELVPEMRAAGAWWIIPVAAAGLFGPTVVEQLLHRADFHVVEARTHLIALAVSLGGVAVHALIEGAAIAELAVPGRDVPLALAIVFHRIPIGLAAWWLLRPAYGIRAGWSAVAALAAVTALGFAVGPALTAAAPSASATWLRALVAGSLLHVVFFRTHLDHHQHDDVAAPEPTEARLPRR